MAERDHERDRVVVTAYTGGLLTLRQIGETLGISHERVRQILEREGIPRRTPTPPQLRGEDTK